MLIDDLPRLSDEDRDAVTAGGIAMQGVPVGDDPDELPSCPTLTREERDALDTILTNEVLSRLVGVADVLDARARRGSAQHSIYEPADQISQCVGLARILLQTISRLEDEADMPREQLRTLIDIRLSAEILCERLSTP